MKHPPPPAAALPMLMTKRMAMGIALPMGMVSEAHTDSVRGMDTVVGMVVVMVMGLGMTSLSVLERITR